MQKQGPPPPPVSYTYTKQYTTKVQDTTSIGNIKLHAKIHQLVPSLTDNILV